jgi:SNF2 family DNA or RNA helicase
MRLGVPDRVSVVPWRSPGAVRLSIGWFDDTGSDLPQDEAGGEGADGAGAPLADAADLMRRLAVALQPPISLPEIRNGTLEWPAPLLPYQRIGVVTLLERRSLLLADSMGLGKTVQAIAALRILYHRGQIESALVVCPASLLLQWRKELSLWAPNLRTVVVSGSPAERGTLWKIPAHVRLVGYETLRTDVLELPNSPVTARTWSVVILDEASRIKNRQSTISIACKRVPRDRRWALTGTPLENRIEDVASILEFLAEEPGAHLPAVSGSDELQRMLHSVQLRRRKEDVLPDLPVKRVNEVVLPLLPEQRKAYDRAEQEGIIQLQGANVTVVHVLELISRLKQLCNVDPESGESAKLTDISERMRGLVADGHRSLVFSQFTDSTFGILKAAEYLRAFNPLVFTGALSPERRARVVEQFISDSRHKALLLSLRAGGQGLNLQAASYVFHLDRWWNPAIEDQADSRSHRLGQTYPVTVYRYICSDTIEERIDAVLREKRKLFQSVVDDVSLDITSTLSESEIFGLFGLRGPRASR